MNAVTENYPVEQAPTAEVTATFNPLVDMVDASYRFKKDKMGNQRATVKGKIPIPSVEGIVAILKAGGKQLELLQDAVYDVVRSVVGEAVGQNENLKALEELDMSKFSWEAIANMPKEDRRSSSIPEEVWKAFAEDYIKVMPGVTGKNVDAVTNATLVYLKKFAPWKTDKKLLNLLKQQLAIYMEQPSAEQYTDILEVLVRRVEAYLAADDLATIAQNL